MPPEARRFLREDAGFPARLLELDQPPAEVTLSGTMTRAPTIAVVGSRAAVDEARGFTRELAAAIVAHGGIVASGGAVGVDAAAHGAALDAGGVTWAVAATGPGEVFPGENAPLFDRIARQGVVIWPFGAGKKASPASFFQRNGVLVALSDLVVIVQAGAPSGTLNTARWAARLGRPVWAVCAPPWVPGFSGCALAVERGARPLLSLESWLRASGLVKGRPGKGEPKQRPPSPRMPTRPLAPVELDLLRTLSATRSRHIDEIAVETRLSAEVVATALLTLALEDVVVEGPDGFYRLANTPIST